MPLTTGMLAPQFTAQDQAGQTHTLEQYRGQWVLLYFYPEDDTPGCTTEACGIRDNFDQFVGKITVLGVSKDSVASHQKFQSKYQLPFTLLSDPNQELIAAYGADGVFFPKRISFLIDPDGKIAKLYPKVKVATHAQTILKDFASLQTP